MKMLLPISLLSMMLVVCSCQKEAAFQGPVGGTATSTSRPHKWLVESVEGVDSIRLTSATQIDGSPDTLSVSLRSVAPIDGVQAEATQWLKKVLEGREVVISGDSPILRGNECSVYLLFEEKNINVELVRLGLCSYMPMEDESESLRSAFLEAQQLQTDE